MALVLLSILGTLGMLLLQVSELPPRERAWHYALRLIGRT